MYGQLLNRYLFIYSVYFFEKIIGPIEQVHPITLVIRLKYNIPNINYASSLSWGAIVILSYDCQFCTKN